MTCSLPALLDQARQRSPQMIDVYRTYMKIWQWREQPPSATDLAILQSGVDAFRRSAELAWQLARFHQAAGDLAAAAAVVDRAQARGADGPMAPELAELSRTLAVPR